MTRDQPKTLDRRNRRPDSRALYNGEGSLLYGGAVGYDGIAEASASALRDSIEDYEYLAQLEAAGKRAQADEGFVPRQLGFEWEKDSAAYEGRSSSASAE